MCSYLPSLDEKHFKHSPLRAYFFHGHRNGLLGDFRDHSGRVIRYELESNSGNYSTQFRERSPCPYHWHFHGPDPSSPISTNDSVIAGYFMFRDSLYSHILDGGDIWQGP